MDLSKLSDAELDKMIADAKVNQIESGGAPDTARGIVNPKSGARGNMQVLPTTAKDPGFGVKPSNGAPADDARMGREYRAALEKHYGNPDMAAIAYNWGPGKADAWMKAGADISKLPTETLDYLIKYKQLGGESPAPAGVQAGTTQPISDVPQLARGTGSGGGLPPDREKRTGVKTGNETLDKFVNKLLGVSETQMSVASSIPAGVIGSAYGVGKSLLSGKYGTQEGVRIGEKAADDATKSLTYTPRTSEGRGMLESIGRGFDATKLAGLPPDMNMIGRIPEVPQGVRNTAAPVADAASAAKSAVGQGAARGIAKALPAVDPETLRVAREGHSMGFRFRPDQLYENKFGRIAGQLSSDVPLSGETASRNQRVFNQQLIKTIGGTGDKLTRGEYSKAMNRAGQEIGRITESHDIPVNDAFVDTLHGQVTEAQRFSTPEVERVVRSYVDDILDKTNKAGNLPGKALRPILTKLKNQVRQTQNGDLKHALIDLQDSLEDAFAPQLSAEEAERYQTARRQYAIGKTIEPLVAKSPGGNISPKALMGAVTSNAYGKRMMAMGKGGDLGKLADIGSMFLREPGTSNTAERGLVAGALTGAGWGISPLAAAGPWAGANLYNRLGPEIIEQLLRLPPKP